MVRTSIVFGAVAIGLLASILLVDRGQLSTRELEQREHSVLPEMIRDKVSRIEIQRKGQSVVLERDLDAMDERGLWRVTAPYQALADRDEVDTLLGELEWMDSRRKLVDISEADRRRFGFETPRYRVRFKVGAVDVTALVGNESPRGEGIYVQGRDRGVAFVVGKDLVEALDREPEHYHTKELHDGLILATITGIEISDGDGRRAVSRRSDRLFQLSEGGRGLASRPAIKAAVDALHALRASRFIATDVQDGKAHGLDSPELEIKVRGTERKEEQDEKGTQGAKDTKDEVARIATELRLRVGGPCGEHAEERYLAMGDGKDVFCARDADLAPLRLGLDDMREQRPLPLEDGDVESVRIEGDGRVLELSQKDDVWSYRVTKGGTQGPSGPAREGSVADWLQAVRATPIEQFDVAPLGAAPVRIEIVRRGSQPPFVLEASASTTHTLLQRDGEDFTVALPPGALELLSPPAVGFRPLQLTSHEQDALTRVVIARTATGQAEETLERGDAGTFLVSAPVQLEADRLAAGELARLLSALEAVRMVADTARPEHGLATPAAVVRAHFGDDLVVLELGREAEDGRFARLEGDPAVFIAPQRLWDQLAQPLVSRTALSVPLEQLRSIELSAGPRSVRVSGEGGRFTSDTLDGAASLALAETVATLRASAVTGYGAAAPEHGIAAPHARLRLTFSDGSNEATREVLIGAPADDGTGARHARLGEQPVGFLLPTDQVEALLAALK